MKDSFVVVVVVFNDFIYLIIFAYAGSSLLCRLFSSSYSKWGLLLVVTLRLIFVAVSLVVERGL